MLFNSHEFLFAFLPVTLAGCFLLARFAGPQAAQLWLTAASVYFYASWNLKYLPLLAVSIAFNCLIARWMLTMPEDRRRWPLRLAIVIDLALLGYYKYANFFVDTVNQASGSHFAVVEILLPLGISFYTFQQITLLVDICGGDTKRFRARDFLLFVTFFPHLIAGPIVHHGEMMPQFERARYRLDWHNLAVGLTLFCIGLFKKAVLADGIAGPVAPIFRDATAGHAPTLLYAWGATLGFALQMYFDFSGYSEMALGLGRMVGIRLPMNFNAPLKASSIIEYWSCWHMTLTRFLTGYVYNPIAMSIARRRRRKRGAPVPWVSMIALPTMLTMGLSGLWHGAGFPFIVFGLLHGVYLTVNHAWRIYRPRFWHNEASYARVMRPAGLVMTLVASSVALTYFRASSLAAGSLIVRGLAGVNGVALPDVIQTRLGSLASALQHAGVQFVAAPLPALLTLFAWNAGLLVLALIPPTPLQVLIEETPAITLPLPYSEDRRITPLPPSSSGWSGGPVPPGLSP